MKQIDRDKLNGFVSWARGKQMDHKCGYPPRVDPYKQVCYDFDELVAMIKGMAEGPITETFGDAKLAEDILRVSAEWAQRARIMNHIKD
jgi:hypothetical protein